MYIDVKLNMIMCKVHKLVLSFKRYLSQAGTEQAT